MKYPTAIALRFTAAAVLLLGSASLSSAADMTFSITNNHSAASEAALYGEDNETVWPSSSTVYSFDKGETKAVTLSCQEGERICYGAWAAGDTQTYWGVGSGNQHDCSYCCYTCSDGKTEAFNLVE